MKPLKGYSALELLVTVAAIATLSVVTLPRATNMMNNVSLGNDAQQVAALCQSARFLSVSNKASYRLHWTGAKLEVQQLVSGAYSAVDSYTLSQPVSVATNWSADPVF